MKLKLTPALVIVAILASAPLSHALTSAEKTANAPDASSSASAVDSSNPYAIIVDRNIFHLQPLPPPKQVEEKAPEVPKVFLNGIFKVGENVHVLFSIPAKDAKNGSIYFNLSPGEQDGVLELLRIHPDQQGVDIVVSGTPESLTLASNNVAVAGAPAAPQARPGPAPRGAAPAPAAAAAAPPGGQSQSSVMIGKSEKASSGGGVIAAGGGVTTIGGNNGSSGVISAGNGLNSTSSGSGVSVSGGGDSAVANLFSGTAGTGAPGSATTPLVPPEQQPIVMAAQYQLNQQRGLPFPPVPPNIAEMMGDPSASGPTVPQPGQK